MTFVNDFRQTKVWLIEWTTWEKLIELLRSQILFHRMSEFRYFSARLGSLFCELLFHNNRFSIKVESNEIAHQKLGKVKLIRTLNADGKNCYRIQFYLTFHWHMDFRWNQSANKFQRTTMKWIICVDAV